MEKFIKQATFFHQDLESQMKADSTRRIFSPINKVNYKVKIQIIMIFLTKLLN